MMRTLLEVTKMVSEKQIPARACARLSRDSGDTRHRCEHTPFAGQLAAQQAAKLAAKLPRIDMGAPATRAQHGGLKNHCRKIK
jgi:hypothetical protein